MHYLIVKDKKQKSIIYFGLNSLEGYNMTSKSKNIKLKDAINVNKMVIINPSFVEKLVDKKIDKKLCSLINLIINIYDNDEDPTGTMMQSLNEVSKFKREVLNKYLKLLNQKQLENLDKKIKYLEHEVTMKSFYMNESRSYEDDNRKRR